ncbi:copper resistance protein B [Geopseudomonas sagittaria]|uniref:Copper resistance protein B n=1 Tax=Geopseudomonas sagittaria TaxID=1135990 RepID=A0A1I5Q186_9GAMM|nr:copper resistance protein B [Pseudomonas sagittaria]SFP40023.1 copper resistance protein B [Pseudomonas sagittaria]
MASKLPLALALSLGVIAAAQAAEPEDHSAHAGHGEVAPAPVASDPHAGHHPQPAAPAPAAAQGMPMMDHGQMGHGDMSHEQMMRMHQQHMQQMQSGQMDHGGMSHEQMMRMHQQHMQQMQGQPQAQPGAAEHAGHHPAGYPGAPVPPITDADRAAAFPDLPPHAMHQGGINYLFLADQLEWQDADEGSALAWDLSGWIGGDIDRLAFRSEGERVAGHTEEAELQLLWSHAIGPWWETVAGVRQDFKPGSPQTWAAFGIQGMPLYGLETEATAFLGEGGQSALRLGAEYDILLTNRLILQPAAEANLHGRNDDERGVGSGFSDLELGLRLRYEIRREFAPYIGATWHRAYGNTADLHREHGEDVEEARLVAGIRFWF